MSRDSTMTKPGLADRFALWLCNSRVTDGLWIGATGADAEPSRQRVEAALRLIDQCAPLHYRRVKNDLTRIWVTLVAHGAGCYLHSLNACLLDERIVASEDTTLEWIASTIIHEATHARLEKRGIRYDEAVRHRIERICARRELDFARRLPGADALIEEINWRIEQCEVGKEAFSDRKMWEEMDRGDRDVLRHLGAPEWVITVLLRTRDLVFWLRRLPRRMTPAAADDRVHP